MKYLNKNKWISCVSENIYICNGCYCGPKMVYMSADGRVSGDLPPSLLLPSPSPSSEKVLFPVHLWKVSKSLRQI